MTPNFRILADDDPLWEKHSGGSGHRLDPEWSDTDGHRAQVFYDSIPKRTKSFLDLLIDRPGAQINAEWIADQLAIPGDTAKNPRSIVSGILSGTGKPRKQATRRYPYYWWDYTGGPPTDYAMKRTVADLFTVARSPAVSDPRGGYSLALARFRLGQQRFRKELLERFGSECAFTGPQPEQALEAAHLYRYSMLPEHNVRGGLLLRRDLHTLFDSNLIMIDPETWLINVAPGLAMYPELAKLQGRPLTIPAELRPLINYIEDHANHVREQWLAAHSPGSGPAGHHR